MTICMIILARNLVLTGLARASFEFRICIRGALDSENDLVMIMAGLDRPVIPKCL